MPVEEYPLSQKARRIVHRTGFRPYPFPTPTTELHDTWNHPARWPSSAVIIHLGTFVCPVNQMICLRPPLANIPGGKVTRRPERYTQ